MLNLNIFNKKPFLIANIGFNFYDIAKKEDISNMDAAKLMIDEAKSCGIDAVKFYSYDLDNIFSKDFFDSNDELSMLNIDLFKKYDKFDLDFCELFRYCNEKGILFLVTPFDFESVNYLDGLLDMYCISSSDLTNIPFIKYVASKNKPMIISTGASTINEIRTAIKAIEEVSYVDIAIMHTVLSYPTDYNDANLLMIKDLAAHFSDYEIGYCDHTITDDEMLVLTTAFNYGAVVLEKHFTLDKSLKNNHCHSMDSDDVIKFKSKVDFLSRIMGHFNKQPLICESSARQKIRKSIVASQDIRKGDKITESNTTFKIPGTGISPDKISDVIGKIANQDIKKDCFIEYDMFD